MEKTKNGVHILYKKLGQSPFQAMEEYRLAHPELTDVPLTYAGRLDPMAEGLLIVLSGKIVNDKEKYLNLPKTYVCKVLWGFETDTADVLGLISRRTVLREGVLEVFEVEKYLEKIIGKSEQRYPAYSSRPVNGKPLFKWAREGRLSEIEIPTHNVEVFSFKFISREEISGENLFADIISKINLVSGDFRQDEIKKKWQENLIEQKNKNFVIDTIELNVGSGFYVRQFITDIVHHFHTPAVTHHILRTRVGDFSI